MKRILLILIAIYLSGTLYSCDNRFRYEAEFLNVFDTVTQIISYMDSRQEFEEFSGLIYDELYEYHRLYDIYNDYPGLNNIKTINDNAGKEAVTVDQKIIDMLLFSKEAYIKTGGKCNIALGSVLEIWHSYREKGIYDHENASLPPIELLQSAMEHTDINKIIIDTEDSTVYLSDPEMSLDVGAVAKGYAVEEVCKNAEEQGYTSALVSVGGNIRAIGDKDGKSLPWSVGIQNPDPDGNEPLITMVDIVGKSVVTSGIYERYYTVDGKNYHHIIDPETLMPADYYISVSIICRDSGIADVLSTAIFCMPFQESFDLINTLDDTEAFWVFPDNTVKYSENFASYILPL
ncbi:MAG: FAD:protein FMN transferase [Eubacteriales bacterium]|nr:FAD:protein FMN transferase [Eubacteriales bacterium]